MSVYRELATPHPDSRAEVRRSARPREPVRDAGRRLPLWCVLLATALLAAIGLAASAGVVAVWMLVRAFR